ncbi:MAG: hypothetical protein SFW67_31605 [Myxococcaceae bacterium]|nr:hypothetical protein [Myxococcaceae bacterium]
MPPEASGLMHFINSDWALIGSTPGVVGLAAVVGGWAWLRTLGALVVSAVSAVPGWFISFFVGLVVARVVTSNPYEGSGVVATVAFAGAALTFIFTLALLLRRRPAQWGVVSLLTAFGAATVMAFVDLRGQDLLRAHATLQWAPVVVRAPQPVAP